MKINCKTIAKYYNGYCVVETTDPQTGEKTAHSNFLFKEFSFDKSKQDERNKYVNDSFEIMAEYLGIDVETLVAEAKKRMRRKI